MASVASRMRARGSRVGLGEVLGAHRALEAVDPADRDQAYLALRAALCAGREDLDRFALAFASVFGDLAGTDAPLIDPVATAVLPRLAIPDAGRPAGDPFEADGIRPSAASEIELLRDKDFSDYTDAERAAARAILARLARRGPTRRARRTRAVRRPGSHLDARATLRASLRHAGEPFDRRWRAPRTRPRPLVLICDVSGSMQPYARMLLTYAHACVQARNRCEAFAFSTRLTRITRELGGRDPEGAVRRAAAAAPDWSGGTRIGEAISELNRVHGRRIGRGSVVTILSDGWERGDPELLGREVERLARCAHRLVWLNPLSASPDYEPLVRGMAAALPHVDLFLAGNTLNSIERLAESMDRGFEERRG
ncbi:MAG: vWA domain-containing protein [Solirubrobacterales bacterium]